MRVDRIGTFLFAGALIAAGFWGCDGGADGETGGGGSGTTSSTTTTTTTTTSVVSSTTTGGGTSFLGLECASDADCGTDGKCSQVTDNDPILGGGPAAGYCTKACTESAECPSGTCVTNGNGDGECFLNCAFGQPEIMFLDDPLDPTKCHGREDLRCQELSGGEQVCLPTCGSDVQCDGRVCDPRLAVCVDDPNMGKALGEKCDTEATTEECAGTCIGITGGKSMCTSPCVMAGEILDTFDCGGVDKGVCLYSPSGTGAGDLGFCAESCTQHDTCQTPTFMCFNIGLPDNGVCLDTDACNTDADCDFLDATCVETNLGKFCASAQYPLGTLEPGTGGTGGTGGTMSGSGGSMSGAGGAMTGSGGSTMSGTGGSTMSGTGGSMMSSGSGAP